MFPRIALVHFHLESNRAAPQVKRADFAKKGLLLGDDVKDHLKQNTDDF